MYASPFFPHLLDAWNKRHHPNLLFVFYEDLKRDLRGEVQKVAKFLGKSLTGEQLELLVDHLRVDKFAKNKAVNFENYKDLGFMNQEGHFIRKGKVKHSTSIKPYYIILMQAKRGIGRTTSHLN